MLAGLGAWAQSLIGTVTDCSKRPVGFANIAVLASSDSIFLGGAVSDNAGNFIIDNVRNGNILRVSSVGFRTAFVVYRGEERMSIELHEDERLLGEVVVKAHQPKTILRGEGMTTIVAGSVLEKAGSMENMLNLIPYVSARNGSIEVFGRGTPEIYINGRKMRDRMELERLQPDEIKNVEVITNPGARYDAHVTSVIRITTKKPVGEGFSIDTKTSFAVNEHKRTSAYENLSMNYRTGKLDVSAQLYGAYTHSRDDKQLRQQTFLNEVWEQTNEIAQEYTNINPYVRLAANYMPAENHSFGASISYDRYAKNSGTGDILSIATRDGMPAEKSMAHYHSPAQSTSTLTNVYYAGKVGKVNIDFNADYFRYGKNERVSNIERYEESGKPETAMEVNSNRRTRNSLVATKLVLSFPLCSGNLSAGGEYSKARRKSFYAVLPQDIVDDDDSRIKETMAYAFASYGRTLGKLYVQAGVRFEHVDFSYYDRGVRIDGQSKTFDNLFPSIALSMPVGKIQMQLAYASDISRPSYNNLRAGVQFDNRYTYETGNPFLVPSISRNLSYALSWKWLSFSAMYAHVSDDINTLTLTYKDNPLTVLARPENMPSYDKAYAALSLNPAFGIWHPSLGLSVRKQWFYMDTPDGRGLCNPQGMFKLTNTFDTKWITVSLIASANTEGHNGNMLINRGGFSADMSVYKSFFRDRLIVQLYASDIFGTADQHAILYSGLQRKTYYTTHSTSSVNLSVRYRFNTATNRYKGTGAGQSQKSRM